MKILAIETSCDDTAIAIVQNFKILSSVVSSQIKIHKKWGGVYPAMASREHKKNLISVLKKSLKENNDLILNKDESISLDKIKIIEKILERDKGLIKKVFYFLKKYKKPKIDFIAITIGPGLDPCLWVGVNFARALSVYWNIPIIPINHIESHILINLINLDLKDLDNINKIKIDIKKKLPAICLIVSGGHTQLILMKDIGNYKIIGETRDDAAGECFDKTARIIGLDYPGGPAIEKEALKVNKCKLKNFNFNINLPRPMINTKDYDFSFSGLKTAVLYKIKEEKKLSKKTCYRIEMSNEIQEAIIDVLIKKTLKAVNEFNVKTIIIGGGVSANKKLRESFYLTFKDFDIFFPDIKFSGDNAAMIGITALFKKPKSWKNIKVNANLRIDKSL